MSTTEAAASSVDQIVLVHGFAAHRAVLRRLERQLESPTRRTDRWGYPSLRLPIDDVASRFAEYLQSLDRDDDARRIHLVTHSMGCIVSRAALQRYRPHKLGRWVMLAPPNQGAYSADTWAWPLGLVFPPVRQLSTSPDSFVNRLPAVRDVEFGIVAASYDWIIRTRDTHLPDQLDHITIPCIHSQLMWDTRAARQVSHFLERGSFQRNLKDPCP